MALEEFVADWLRRGTGVLYSHIFLPSLKDKALANFTRMDFGNDDGHRCPDSTGTDFSDQSRPQVKALPHVSRRASATRAIRNISVMKWVLKVIVYFYSDLRR